MPTRSELFRRYLEARRGPSAEARIAELQDPRFKEQHAFVMDPSTFIAALCTRRAGKTNGLALRFLRTLYKYPGSMCPYIALTRDSAKNIMWPVLEELNEKKKLGATMTESNLTMTLRNGSRLKLFGADQKNFIKRLRGPKYPGAGVDEVQDFGAHIQSLVEDVLEPAISDFADGWIALTGTPGPVPTGFFYDVTEEGKYGYSLHKWSCYDNPYLPNARAFVENLKKKKGWSDTNPTLLREWCGQWVLDLDALVFKYQAAKNHFDELPKVQGIWQYVIGVDIGHDDADAIAVIGWPSQVKRSYLVEEYVQAGNGITELAEAVEARIKTYDPLRVVIDTGGLGKKIAKEMRTRFGIPVEAAEKDRKFEFIELLNDAMRAEQFLAKRDSQFAKDAARVKWDKDSPKLKIADGFHSDIGDAVLYGYRESLHWLEKTPEPKLKTGSAEWVKKQAEDLERAAEAQFKRRKDRDDPWGGESGW
jgi:hypothetical protein